MKKMLKIKNACSENWDKMTPNNQGNFCDLCAKTVLDFSQLSQNEILKKINSTKESICAKVTKTQLETPISTIFPIKQQPTYKLPYNKVAASIILAASLTSAMPLMAQKSNAKNQHPVEQIDTSKNTTQKEKKSQNTVTKVQSYATTFKGNIISKETNKPIVNAKITFVTLHKLYTAYTSKTGDFKLFIPSFEIKNDNVVRVTFYDVKRNDNDSYDEHYRNANLILNADKIVNGFEYKAENEMYLLGMINARIISKNTYPIVINNGVKVDYKEFSNAKKGEKSSCSLENKDYIYFNSDAAIVLYGKKAKYGLYLIINKE